MNRLTLLVILMVLLTGHLTAGKTLKAMLYCYLPAVNTGAPMEEYNNLAAMINDKLKANNINVVVDVCDPNGNGGDLYDPQKINTLFDDHDILEVDVSYLWAITVPLLQFSKSDIEYYDRVYPFEWLPTTKNENGKQVIIGSPGLLCSDFLETRTNGGSEENTFQIGQVFAYLRNLLRSFVSKSPRLGYQEFLYANYKPSSAYGLVTYYLNAYINGAPGRTLDNMDYSKIDDETIAKVANFLKNCQENKDKFVYDNNKCIFYDKNLPFLKTDYSTTVGYSENLFNFENAGIPTQNIQIQHVTKDWQKKLFYVDSFVAKDTTDSQDQKTILKFYEFMLSDQVLDLYVKGLYTNSPKTTYLLPPVISYFQKLIQSDPLYRQIYKSGFLAALIMPIYQASFAQNLYTFAGNINEALKSFSATTNEL